MTDPTNAPAPAPLDPFRPPIGPDTAGYLDESTYLAPDLLDLLWRNEINTLCSQYAQLMLTRLSAFQVLNFCTFMTVQIAQQVITGGDQRSVDLVNFYTTRAFQHFDTLSREGVFKKYAEESEESKGPRFLLQVPAPLNPDERNTIKKALDSSPRLEQ